jgi:cellulose 1,4-beta-cellobiosidase
LGNTSFYGPGKTVDTTKKFTITTQFVTSDGTAEGSLVEIKRFYTQGGMRIANPQANTAGVSGNSLTSSFCEAEKVAFGDPNAFKDFGGFKGVTQALKNGMVLAMSVWDDRHQNMLWLDGTWPVNTSAPGDVRGPCLDDDASIEATIGVVGPTASVVFSKIRFGDIGSTA